MWRGLTKLALGLGFAAGAAPAAGGGLASRLSLTGGERGVSHRYTAEFIACQAPAVSNYQIEACLRPELARQQERLTFALREASRRVGHAKQATLRTAQRRWERQRDPFCRRERARVPHAPIAELVYLSCQTELTIRRTIWLEQFGG